MSALLGRLPPELLVDILTRLDSTSQKAFRCVSRSSCGSVTSLLFNELLFDFDVGGTEGLVAISNHPHLAKHVRTIVLQRRNSLRKLDDFRAWQQATVYEYEAYVWEGEFKWLKGVMSQSEWDNMTEETRRALFDEYNSDYAAITRRTTQLAVAMSSNIYTNFSFVPATQTIGEAGQTIRNFSESIKRLSNLVKFLHNPSYCFDNWGECWRNVQFHRSGLILQTGYEDDVDTDVLHLFNALSGVMLSKTIRHVELCTRGHAFWSIAHLRRLLDWNSDTLTRWMPDGHVAVGIEDWMEQSGGPVAACRYIESATRFIVALESRFSRLEVLECHIDTQGVESADELIATSKAVSQILQQGTKLRSLKLALRESSWELDQHSNLYRDDLLSKRLCSMRIEDFRRLTLASRGLFGGLVETRALRELVKLELTVVTTEQHLCTFLSQLKSLRHLDMKYVPLLPTAGVWESVLNNMSTVLSLDTVAFRSLEDVIERQPRLLLEPQASVWNSSDATRDGYRQYEKAIVNFVLRRSDSPPPLCPTEYLHRQEQLFKMNK
jgi:hypothetical protein